MAWTATWKSFNDDNQLMKWAQCFIGEKLSSLERDVKICMGSYPPAPFPAMLYCFSIIDMLGAFYCGEAHSLMRNTSKNSATYMKDMMGYTQDDCHLLQKIFRHKLVHLAGPNSVFKYNQDKITWHYARDLPERHLQLKSLLQGIYIHPENTRIKHKVSHQFWMSLEKLVEDITQSVQNPNGYFSKLKADPTLREKLDDAVWDMFSPSA